MSRTIELLTYADLIDHLIDFTSANPSPQKVRQAKRAISDALNNFRNDFNWPYFYTTGRICTVAPYDTGTVTFDYTGGSYERQLTLSGGEWPEWAAYGQVLIGAVYYEVAERISASTIQLDINKSPHADITEATTYILVRDTYTLPSDFVNIDKLYTPESWHRIDYVHPREWLVAHRYNVTSASTPCFFTITGSPDFMGSMAIRFYPYPDSEQTIDFIYQRRARFLRIERDRGQGSATEGNDYINVSSDPINEERVGSVIRVSASDAEEYPDGRTGTNPFDEERVIMDVNEAGDQISVDQQFLNQHSNCKFIISDPVDIEPGIMTGALLRRAEMEMAIISRMVDRNDIIKLYGEFLDKHREYASPIMHPRAVGQEGLYSRRLAYMPAGEDVD